MTFERRTATEGVELREEGDTFTAVGYEKRRAKRRERRMAGMAKRRGRRRSSPG